MPTIDPYADLDAHERLMAQLQAATDSCLQVVARAREVLNALTEHNESDTAHADIRQIIRSAAYLTDEDLSTAISIHNNSERAHPYLIAKIDDAKNALQSSISLLQGQVSDLQTSDNSFQQHMSAAEEAIAAAQSAIAALENAVGGTSGTSLTDRVSAAEAAITTLQNQAESLSNLTNQLNSNMTTLTTMTQTNANAIAGLEAIQQDQVAQIGTLTSKQAATETNVTDLQSTLNDARELLSSLTTRVETIETGGVDIVSYVIEIPSIIEPIDDEVVSNQGFQMSWTECVTRRRTPADDTWYINAPQITAPVHGEITNMNSGTLLMTWTEADVRTLSDLDTQGYVIERPGIITPYDGAIVPDGDLMFTFTEAVVKYYRV